MGLLYSSFMIGIFYVIFGLMVVGILAFCYLITRIIELYEDWKKRGKS